MANCGCNKGRECNGCGNALSGRGCDPYQNGFQNGYDIGYEVGYKNAMANQNCGGQNIGCGCGSTSNCGCGSGCGTTNNCGCRC